LCWIYTVNKNGKKKKNNNLTIIFKQYFILPDASIICIFFFRRAFKNTVFWKSAPASLSFILMMVHNYSLTVWKLIEFTINIFKI